MDFESKVKDCTKDGEVLVDFLMAILVKSPVAYTTYHTKREDINVRDQIKSAKLLYEIMSGNNIDNKVELIIKNYQNDG